MIANVAYIARRAPQRSDSQPPTGRSNEAGKMKLADNRPAVVRSTPKFLT